MGRRNGGCETLGGDAVLACLKTYIQHLEHNDVPRRVIPQPKRHIDSLPGGAELLSARIEAPLDEVVAFCKRWQVTEFALFGSVLRGDFSPESDVDVLVSFEEEARHTLFDMERMETELSGIFGREIDLVSRRGIEASRNRLRRNAILESAEVIYGP